MELDDLLRRYFGSADLAGLAESGQAAGVEHMLVDLGLEQDAGKRFALWSVLYLQGAAPPLDVVFASEPERDAARSFMDLCAMSQAVQEE